GIVQEEDALAKARQRGGAELIAASAALRDVVVQAGAHVVDFHVGEEVGGGGAEAGGQGRCRRREGRSVAGSAPDRTEDCASPADGSGAAGRCGRRSGLIEEADEESEAHQIAGSAEGG